MIYLIDDNQNQQRQKNYNITYIEEGFFNSYLTSIEKLEPSENFSETGHLNFLKSADCILLHSSTEDYITDKGFVSGSRSNVIKIKEIISEEGDLIPLVLFSNSMGNPDYDDHDELKYIRGIKKNIFYERLYDFIEYYKINGKVELKIIAQGKNFAVNESINQGKEILRTIQGKNNSDLLLLEDLTTILEIFKSFIEYALSPLDFEIIMTIIKDQKIKVQDFKKNINLIIESYTVHGKNIHTWKQSKT